MLPENITAYFSKFQLHRPTSLHGFIVRQCRFRLTRLRFCHVLLLVVGKTYSKGVFSNGVRFIRSSLRITKILYFIGDTSTDSNKISKPYLEGSYTKKKQQNFWGYHLKTPAFEGSLMLYYRLASF